MFWFGARGNDSDAADAFNLYAVTGFALSWALRRDGLYAVMRRLCAVVLAVLFLAGCVTELGTPGPAIMQPAESADTFVMPDGFRLPYRAWLPEDAPRAVILALHGMNDSRDAWEYTAPDMAQAGMAVFSPDLRGFGATGTRGLWPGAQGLVADARAMASLLRERYPHTRLILMGESMGAAVLMNLATEPGAPDVDGYVLIAPAVWGRSKMNWFLRTSLFLASNTVPGMRLTGRGVVKVTATDNRVALRRLSTDPLTLRGSRVDAIRGLVDLMDSALAAAPRFRAPALFMYGGKDELIPAKATAATWRVLPDGPVRAFYPDGYHLLLRDLRRAAPIQDVLAWIARPALPLPSGADRAAAAWLAMQDVDGSSK